ncbi:MAG: FeoB-associated Cys-rich membrane protein [Spirochaetaceae bacterium]|jgi:hypothetical protein|nr:FeoB-associated Cys-rich membrane protein [Spirochaetaceae bacterium]GMO30425.1 MAG: hypothetical protein Pg6A_19410 [Termitinemataceae bacterium]
MGNIIIGTVVFGIIALIVVRIIIKAKRGETGCSCGNCCDKCKETVSN